MQKILPVQIPFTTTFPKDANAVSILLNYPETYPWLMNCFIQLTCWGNQFLDYYDFYYRNCPLIEYQRIKKELIGNSEDEYIDFIIALLEKDYYIMLQVQTKYIQKYDFDAVHDMFIYGYDGNDKFYIADNFAKGMYERSVCTRGELRKAIKKIPDDEYWSNGYRGTIEAISYNSEKRAVFEPYRVKESIKDYLQSTATKNWYTNYAMWNEDEIVNRCFGVRCYDAIFHHLKKAKEGEEDASCLRALHIEFEHKKIMGLRLKWISKEYSLKDSYFARYNEVEKNIKMALMLYLKFKITSNLKIIDKITEIYIHAIDTEAQILNGLLHEL